MAAYEDSLNAEDVARILNIGRNAVYGLAKSGELRSYKMGRKLLFTLEDVDAYFRRKCGKDAPAGPAAPGPAAAAPALDPAAPPHTLAPALSAFAPAVPPLQVAGEGPACASLVTVLQDGGLPAQQSALCDYTALASLYAEQVDAAVVCLYDCHSNTCNVPFVQRLAPGLSVVVVRLAAQQAGLVVARGNPKKISSWSGLFRGRLRLVNRPKGTCERILLDQKAIALETFGSYLEGYDAEAPTVHSAAMRVSQGLADVCLGTAASCRQVPGVQFVPLQKVTVDLVVRKSASGRKRLRALKDLLASETARAAFSLAGPWDCTNMGAVVYEC